MKLRVTVTFDVPVKKLERWDASTIEEAASNQLRWYNEGLSDVLEDAQAASSWDDLTVNVEAVH